jgi:predicted GNAT superfamily acetyltransferase
MDDLLIRECQTIDEWDQCVLLQRDVFALPDLEISPRRHLIVSQQAGGWTLGAFEDNGRGRIVGFVHHLAAVRDKEIFGYSHMMAVHRDYQNKGVGAKLKWAQRQRALSEGQKFIKWTWDPMQARNAHFNLNRLGVTVTSYADNFYGTDYGTSATNGIDSDRLFANWSLGSTRVMRASEGLPDTDLPEVAARIEIPPNWTGLVQQDASAGRREQLRVRNEFQNALASGLICAGFDRNGERPGYLLYRLS